MWTCKQCAEEIEDQFESCWKCSTTRAGAAKSSVGETRDAPDESLDEDEDAPDSAHTRAESATAASIGPRHASNPASTRAPKGSRAAAVLRRYKDAYLVSRTIIAVGGIVKGMGLVVCVVAVLVGFGARNLGGMVALVAGIFIGLVLGGLVFAIGIVVAAQGQLLAATIDTSVNSSSFLTEDQKAKVMGL